jgi:Regulator of ribonuclease activity B
MKADVFPSREDHIEAAIDGHRVRNEALIARLREFHVALNQPRAIDLHFFAPSELAARSIAAGLKARGLPEPTFSTPGPDGTVSVEVAVMLPVNVVVTRAFIEPLVRIALEFGGVHDGWGTSIEEARPTAG